MDFYPIPPSCIENNAPVLDVGGWAKPHPQATHIVDLFPWETRSYGLHLEKLPGERFTRDTWFQADFLDPELRLPFADKQFAFCVCSHTLEDLKNPEPILGEIIRVSRAGYIEVPSRLHEQTIGVRDRKGRLPGHPHHYWIIDFEEGVLRFHSKQSSLPSISPASAVPLVTYERLVSAGGAHKPVTGFVWRDTIRFEVHTGAECWQRAIDFRAGLPVGPSDRLLDGAVRLARRVRDRVRGRRELMSDWKEIVDRSRPYSQIPLPD